MRGELNLGWSTAPAIGVGSCEERKRNKEFDHENCLTMKITYKDALQSSIFTLRGYIQGLLHHYIHEVMHL